MDSYLRNITKKGVRFKGHFHWNDVFVKLRGERVEVDYHDCDDDFNYYDRDDFCKIIVKTSDGQMITADRAN